MTEEECTLFNPRNLRFQLIENENGLAASATVMHFDDSTAPYKATYRGPNIAAGQVLMHHGHMLYHALDHSGNLNAGSAKISFDPNTTPPTMTLHWRWLTGDGSGISVWHQLD